MPAANTAKVSGRDRLAAINLEDINTEELLSRAPVGIERYSLQNQILLMVQLPTVTVTYSFREWLKRGRVVRKGEQGLAIWAGFTVTDQESDTESDEKGKTKKRFKVATVFDISQTEELPPKE